MRLSNKGELSKTAALKLKTRTVFILTIVINREIAKIKASFLVFWAANTWLNNAFSGHNSSRSPDSGFFWPNSYYDSYHYGWRY